MTQAFETVRPLVVFGQRKMVTRVCIIERKAHIRNFLREELEEAGFLVRECEGLDALRNLLTTTALDTLLMTVAGSAEHTVDALHVVAMSGSKAEVLLVGAPSPALDALKEHGSEIGLRMLPPLNTPYRVEDLRERLTACLPPEPDFAPAIDAEEALRCGWVQLWYEPKLDVRSLSLCGVEAVTRVSHPNCGLVSPSRFLPARNDPHFRSLTHFVVGQAIADWAFFLENYSPVDLAVSLPVPFLEDGTAVKRLQALMPAHPAFHGVLVQIKGLDMIGDIAIAQQAARTLRFSNIAISVDDLGDEWARFVDLAHFPFVEVKVNSQLVTGCADDQLKRSACRTILDMADRFGARTVAKGIETRADLIAAREMGFHAVQGGLFGGPMKAQKFARQILAKPHKRAAAI